MAAIANLALKNNAAAAVVGTVISPSAGDSVPARWRIETATVPVFRPVFEILAKPGATKTARRVNVRITIPHTGLDANGTTIAIGQSQFDGSFVASQVVDSAKVDDAVAYVSSFFADAGVIAALKAQVAPT